MTVSYLGGLTKDCARRPGPVLALILALLALLASAGSAGAHVGVVPREAQPGV